jgi:putative DNA primase/helicase
MFKKNLTLSQAALALVKLGCFIFPCHPKSKRPMTKNGYKDATNNVETVRQWWTKTPNANIGLVPGKSGWIVIDEDGPVGEESLRRLGLDSVKTMFVKTGRGRHLYFGHPGGLIGNTHDLGPGLDIRADAGYVLVPPSIHPNGTKYQWGGLDDE